MGGDGIITYELSDRLADQMMNERFEALVSYLDKENVYLSSEWVTAFFRLRQRELGTGRQLLTPDMFAFAAIESAKMRQLDWLDGQDMDELSTETIAELFEPARDMYYAHSGIHSMAYRQDRLAAVGQVFEHNLDNGIMDSFYLRQTANIHEELAFYEMWEGKCGPYAASAMAYNQRVVESATGWNYPYKMHALISLNDLAATKLLAEVNRPDAAPSLHEGLKDIHIELNRTLEFLTEAIAEHAHQGEAVISGLTRRRPKVEAERMYRGNISNMAGVLAEGLAMSVTQDFLLDSGLHRDFWMRQAFLREDAMGHRRIPDVEPVKLKVPNLSFDLMVYEYSQPDGQRVPVEVKKGANPLQGSLHPDIKVITFKDSRNPLEFAEMVREFAQGQILKHCGQIRGSEQIELYDIITQRVNPARLFE